MSFTEFLRLLHQEIDTAPQAVKRHIIHFKTHKDYERCVKQIKQLTPSLAHLAHIQQMKMINAISCTLHSSTPLERQPRILFIEEDSKVRVHYTPYFPSKYYLSAYSVTNSQTVPWGVREIRAPEVWKRSTGRQIKIGVIDTGIDFMHPDLQSAIARGVNIINRSILPFDDNGHGTHIAGTIAAASSHYGIIGVAPHASIHPVKAFDHNGSAFVSDIIQGIEWCVHNRIQIVNMSFGMKRRSKSLEYAVRNACIAGTVIVASSGNDGRRSGIDYPARLPQTISVGATTRNKKIAPFSNRDSGIDIFAPGDKIYSTWLHGKYNELSGTSMATSHVSGVIALMLATKPNLNFTQIKSILRTTSTPLAGHQQKYKLAGEIDAFRAMHYLQQ